MDFKKIMTVHRNLGAYGDGWLEFFGGCSSQASLASAIPGLIAEFYNLTNEKQ